MKKVKLADLGRGVHFFLENFIEDKKIEFVVVRHFPESAEAQAPDGYTLVEAVADLCKAPFDKDGCNDWRASSLRKYLNEEYLPKLLESFPELKEAAVTFLRDLTADDGLKDYGACVDTVSLLSAEEYKANRDIYMDPPGTWRWLITPDSTPSGGGSSFARYVHADGTLSYSSASYGDWGVRPALYLKSGLFVSVDGVDQDTNEELDKPTPEQQEMALYSAAVEQFGDDAQILIAIEEMSELSKALLKWLRYKNFDQGRRDELLKAIAEERADVGIMLNQLEVTIYGMSSPE